jgi:hypothetical protein
MPSVVTLTGPGSATVTDDAAAAIVLQTVVLTEIRNIAGNNANVMVDLKKEISALSDACNTLKTSIGSIATMSAGTNAIIAMQAANQIQTNNFQVQATKEALERTGQPVPVPPPVAEQIKTAVKDSSVLMEVGQAEGAIVNQINVMAGNFVTWVGSFLPSFTDVSGWIKRKFQAVLQPNPPSNTQDALTKQNNIAGTPDNGNTV